MGLGTHMALSLARVNFCRSSLPRGVQLVRFDNRDIGHFPPHVPQGRPPTIPQLLLALQA